MPSLDLSAAVLELKSQHGQDLIAHGGVEFAQNLVETGLVDEYWLATHPVAIGGGAALFQKLNGPLYLTLVESHAFNSGAIGNVYRPEPSAPVA